MSQAGADLRTGPQTGPPPVDRLSEGVRVHLAASDSTAPAVLEVLAGDGSVFVRAAVAMNRAAPAAADRLLAGDDDARVRALLARRLAGLIPDLAPAECSTLTGHVLGLLAILVEDETVRVRSAIADIVKDMKHAPRDLILRLARDAAAPVSEPVIRLSPLLTTEDLLLLLTEAQNSATATAIARRPRLHPAVADLIATGTDQEAIAALLANRSAAIREATLDMLIARAAQHVAWQEPLVHRPALTPRAARALSEIVTTQLLGVLAGRGDLDAAVIRELRQRLQARLVDGEPAEPPEPTLQEAMAQAQALRGDSRLDEAALLCAAQRGESRLCIAMLAAGARVPVAAVERAVAQRNAKGIVSLVWQAGHSMRCAGPLQMLLARMGPAQVLRGPAGGGFPLAEEEMRWQLGFLQNLRQ
jgi:uncharacterized protein (DUF2336 family)